MGLSPAMLETIRKDADRAVRDVMTLGEYIVILKDIGASLEVIAAAEAAAKEAASQGIELAFKLSTLAPDLAAKLTGSVARIEDILEKQG